MYASLRSRHGGFGVSNVSEQAATIAATRGPNRSRSPRASPRLPGLRGRRAAARRSPGLRRHRARARDPPPRAGATRREHRCPCEPGAWSRTASRTAATNRSPTTTAGFPLTASSSHPAARRADPVDVEVGSVPRMTIGRGDRARFGRRARRSRRDPLHETRLLRTDRAPTVGIGPGLGARQRRGRADRRRARRGARTRRLGGLLAAATFVGVFPANVKAALDGGMAHLDPPMNSRSSPWLRLPLPGPPRPLGPRRRPPRR